MYFDYYAKVVSNEHMLYPHEIANIYGLRSSTGNPHSSLVKSVIMDYVQENNMQYIPLYYETKNGLKEVFSKVYYEPAIKQLLSDCDNKYRSLNQKNYYFNKEER